MSDKSLVSIFSQAPAATQNTFASENFNTVIYTGNGGTQRIGGYINRGAAFNGSSSYIANAADIGFNNSVSMWFNVEPTGANTSYALFGRENGGGLEWGGVNLYYDGTDYNLNMYIRSSAGNYLYASYQNFTLSAGWHHLVFTFDSSSGYTAYIDGSEVTITNGANSGTVSFPSGTSSIGRIYGNNDPAYYFRGKIDQVRIFNKKLSSSEVTTLNGETFESTTKSTTDIFGDGSGVALYQLDGNANDTGGVSGKYGSAAHFNGSSSQITLNSLPIGAGDLTISLWIKPTAISNANYHMTFAQNGYSSGTGIAMYTYGTSTTTANFVPYISIGGSAYNIVNSSGISVNQWTHLALVRDYGNSWKAYMNGTLLTTYTSQGLTTDFTNSISYLGRHSNGLYRFNGFIDDVRIYSDKLTAAEVGYIYNNTTASIPTDNLEAHYTFDGHSRDVSSAPQYDGAASNVKYAYDGTASNVTYQEATKFSPDLVWIKNRESASYNHNFQDTLRGTSSYLSTASTSNEITVTNCITSFDSNGFTIGNNGAVNNNTDDYVAWCWNAGTDSAAQNTDGVTAGSVTAVTSTVKANTAAGFSICTFTTPSSGKPSWGHGLDSAPELIILKNTADSQNWFVYAPSALGQKEGHINLTATFDSYSPDFISSDSSKIDLGSTSFNISASKAHVAYCFHSVDGYSKIGTYTGTGSKGLAVETGFEPAWIMIKGVDSSSDNWFIFDTDRGSGKGLHPNQSAAEFDNTTAYGITFSSNGFVLDFAGTTTQLNTSGNDYLYLAIAADPDETTPTVENSFDVVTYTGTGGAIDVETDFKPDLVWLKRRDGAASSHVINDSVRGANRLLSSDDTSAENTAANYLTGFNDNGFTVGTGMSSSSNNYVGWCWKAGDHDDNLPQINTNGTIDSTVSVNDAAGFSIVKYTATNTTATVGHGLSSAPEVVLVKPLDKTGSWGFYTTAVDGSYDYMYLNQTAAKTDSVMSAPTSTIFNVNNTEGMGTNYLTGEYIAYCWYSVSGHSKIGSYTGNGSTSGPTVTTGFKPRFLMVKSATHTSGYDWFILDQNRGYDSSTGNVNKHLNPNNSDAENTDTTNRVKFTSTGFQIVTNSSAFNILNEDYIYMAFK